MAEWASIHPFDKGSGYLGGELATNLSKPIGSTYQQYLEIASIFTEGIPESVNLTTPYLLKEYFSIILVLSQLEYCALETFMRVSVDNTGQEFKECKAPKHLLLFSTYITCGFGRNQYGW